MTRIPAIAAAALLFAPVYPAQEPVFEVASIKPSPPGAGARSLTHNPGARLTTSNATVKMLLMLAYQVMPDQIAAAPAWLESDGFDIDARPAGPNATPARFRQMIQNLLATRFQLQVHRATRELSVLALVVAAHGPKLGAPKGDDPEVGLRIEAPGRIKGVQATMAMLATVLSKPLQQHVIDRTGLQGAYDFTLRYDPDPNPGSAPATDFPSIVTALHEQLGLTLKNTRAPVEILVVDHAEKPLPN